ncbi:L,D-transpeptidase family protein [Rubrivirga sp. IMCC43871]|uniref:L,D-transpeptidase family protein n=1 Tax=Rubrivirga sp. IMCC43871 TaxID=3391575 RepID=UPI0039901EFF
MLTRARLAALAFALVATAAAASPPSARLATALDRYERADWRPLPDGPLVRPGETDAVQIPALRARLAAEGALGDAARTGDILDPALAAALARAQDRLGLASDGILGPNTRAALDVPAATRAAQVRRSLAALDTLALPSDGRWVLVNVPEYRVRAFEGGRETMRMKAVVGADRDGWRTPLFSDAIEYLELRPVWNVPTNIARDELAPKGAAALAAEGFELVRRFSPDAEVIALNDSTLQKMADGHLLIRQAAGPLNPLGRLKIMFPNVHNVYLHDTSAPAYFARDNRALSHGCVRVERPAALGAWVAGMPEAELAAAMDGTESRRIALPERVPVVLAALPAWAGDDGAVWFAGPGYSS